MVGDEDWRDEIPDLPFPIDDEELPVDMKESRNGGRSWSKEDTVAGETAGDVSPPSPEDPSKGRLKQLIDGLVDQLKGPNSDDRLEPGRAEEIRRILYDAVLVLGNTSRCKHPRYLPFTFQ